MKRKSLPIWIVSVLLFISLMVWNVYLINHVKILQVENKELELKNQILEGDMDMLTYDLVTARDSIRILNRGLDFK